MNVIRGGVWGSFRHLPLTTGNLNQCVIASRSKYMDFVLLCFLCCKRGHFLLGEILRKCLLQKSFHVGVGRNFYVKITPTQKYSVFTVFFNKFK